MFINPAKVHITPLSTYSTAIPFSISFISVVLFSWTKARMMTAGSYKVENGSANAGGTGLRMYVEDGAPSSSPQRFTSVFALFAQQTRQWETC
jgi:hypothetical protein